MAFVYACELPDHLWFDVERDVWVEELGDGLVRLGMTDPAQTRAGRILTLRLKAGKHLVVGKSVGTVESAKWVGPIPSPLAGVVVEVNPQVVKDPNTINRDPYGSGWLVTFRPEQSLQSYGLMRGKPAQEAYRQKLRAEGLTCMRCAPLAEEGNDAQ